MENVSLSFFWTHLFPQQRFLLLSQQSSKVCISIGMNHSPHHSSHKNCGRNRELPPTSIAILLFSQCEKFYLAICFPGYRTEFPNSLTVRCDCLTGFWPVECESKWSVWLLGLSLQWRGLFHLLPLFSPSLSLEGGCSGSCLSHTFNDNSLVMAEQQGVKSLGTQHHWTSIQPWITVTEEIAFILLTIMFWDLVL